MLVNPVLFYRRRDRYIDIIVYSTVFIKKNDYIVSHPKNMTHQVPLKNCLPLTIVVNRVRCKNKEWVNSIQCSQFSSVHTYLQLIFESERTLIFLYARDFYLFCV